MHLDTPLWFRACRGAGHLPRKGGDWLTSRPPLFLQLWRLAAQVDEGVISPLAGEMAGRPEGGVVRVTPSVPQNASR